MLLRRIHDDSLSQAAYLVGCPASREAIVFDCARDVDRALKAAEQAGLRIVAAADTHVHADFVSGLRELVERHGVHGYLSREGSAPAWVAGCTGQTTGLGDGDEILVGSVRVRVLHTPGHTPACVTYLIDNMAFVGDTLFMPDYGTARADFPGGDARALFRSIRKILALPPETRIFVGHDYLPKSRDTFVWETTVAEERARNIHVHDGVSEDDFVALREARDQTLDAPRLILPSLQVNIRAGALPPAEADGQVYLKLPVNRLGAA